MPSGNLPDGSRPGNLPALLTRVVGRDGVISSPAQQLGDLAITVAAILTRQLDDIGRQPILVVTAPRDLALRRAVLPERRTGTTLG